MTDPTNSDALVAITADIVTAYVGNNTVAASEVPAMINTVTEALIIVSGKSIKPPRTELNPAVPIKKSVTPDHIVCLDDGLKFKSLKRHIRTHHGLSPEEYRAKWGLPFDYPMVAPNYAATRSLLAKKMGLGKQRS